MIGKLTGRIDSIDGHHLILDVQGVGYVVAASARTLRQMGGVGEAAALLIETQVREDAISLYGFIDAAERDAFRLLTTVQGVGAKVAQALLGALSPEQLSHAIAAQDKTALTQADGVGPKLALRIVTELKDKVAVFGASALPSSSTASASGGVSGDAVSALVNLGYRRIEAFAAVSAAAQKIGPAAHFDALLRASLAGLSRKDNAV